MRKKWARIEHHSDGLHFHSDYDSYLVTCLKDNILSSDRAWNPSGKYWIIDPCHLDELKRLSKLCLNVDATVRGHTIQSKNITERKIFRVEYIGGLKDRGNGVVSAFGATNNSTGQKRADFGEILGAKNDLEWSIIFPEFVLKSWFNGDDQIKTPNSFTLYGFLDVNQLASQQEIKKAWRRGMKRFHPDINKDTDAPEMTMKIINAYNTLRNPMQRRKYDAGLKLAASLSNQQKQPVYSDWSISVRCGNIMCEGQYKVGRFVVSRILQWLDIIENGKMLVTSWDLDTNSLVRGWI